MVNRRETLRLQGAGGATLALSRSGFAQTPGFFGNLPEIPASWMWHSVNAYERDNTIIADFVGTRSWFHDGGAKIDVESGKYEQFRFRPQCYVGEPVFVPRPKSKAEGWLLCEVLDGHTELSEMAIFDAQAVSSGPVASVKLSHALPFGFHGWWQPA